MWKCVNLSLARELLPTGNINLTTNNISNQKSLWEREFTLLSFIPLLDSNQHKAQPQEETHLITVYKHSRCKLIKRPTPEIESELPLASLPLVTQSWAEVHSLYSDHMIRNSAKPLAVNWGDWVPRGQMPTSGNRFSPL